MKNSEVLSFGRVKVVYSGRYFGNTEPRFSNAQTHQTKEKLLKLLSPDLSFKNLIEINAIGEDRILLINNITNFDKYQNDEFDGVITTHEDLALSLNAADCIPMVISSDKIPLLALIHVGFTGASKGIHLKAIKIIAEKYNINPVQLKVFFGPHIKKQSYKIIDLKDKELSGKWEKFSENNANTYSIDLPGFIQNDLQSAGVLAKNIIISPIDTGSDKNFFSHRRSSVTGETEGRNGFVCMLKNN